MSQAPSTTTVAPWVPRRVIRRRRAGRGNRVSLCLNRRIYGNFQPRRFFQRPRAVDARAATTVLSSKLSPTTLHYNNTAVLHSNNKWYDPASQSTGVYTCDDIVTSLKFDGVRSRKQRLAFGKGDCGVLCVVDKPGDLSALASNMSVADDEAIFDICWADGGSQIGTAQATGVCRVWDVESKTPVVAFAVPKIETKRAMPSFSFKSIRVNPTNPSLFLTSSRDGSVSLYDIRDSARMYHAQRGDPPVCEPVIRYCGIHKNPSLKQSSIRKSRRLGIRPHQHCGTTCAIFGNPEGELIYTAGSIDGLVKVWDLRRFGSVQNLVTHRDSRSRGGGNPSPLFAISEPGPDAAGGRARGASAYAEGSGAPNTVPRPVRGSGCGSPSSSAAKRCHGISHIDLDPTYSRLLVSYVYRSMVVYDLAGGRMNTNESTEYASQQYTSKTFYIKSSWTSDGEYILSGSSDGLGYVYKRAQAGKKTVQPCAILSAGRNEYSDVSCLAAPVTGSSLRDLETLASSSCDSKSEVKLWSLSDCVYRGLNEPVIGRTRPRPAEAAQPNLRNYSLRPSRRRRRSFEENA
jgi:WD40 repeat protein|eukprot:g5407.t1